MPSRNRGKPKPKLRDLSRKWPTHEELNELLEYLASSDVPIVTAILGAAVLEFELERMLRPKFRRQDDDSWKELTGDSGPLATFHMKILAGYAFGICDDTTRDGLNTIRTIRNVFAHATTLLDFRDNLITTELKKVTLSDQKRSTLYKHLSYYVRDATDDPQQAYKSLCFSIAAELERKQNRIEKARMRRMMQKLERLKLRRSQLIAQQLLD